MQPVKKSLKTGNLKSTICLYKYHLIKDSDAKNKEVRLIVYAAYSSVKVTFIGKENNLADESYLVYVIHRE